MRIDWIISAPLAAGYVADLLLGDPPRWPHPVRIFGLAISAGDRLLNRGRGRLIKGLLLVVVLCVLVFGISYVALAGLVRVWLPGYYIVAGVCVDFVWPTEASCRRVGQYSMHWIRRGWKRGGAGCHGSWAGMWRN